MKHFQGCPESQGAETKNMDKFWDAIAGNIIAIAAFMVPVGIVAVTSYFAHKRLELIHRERMAAIERGLIPPGQLTDPQQEEEKEDGAKPAPNYLRRGLFWLCPGAGLVAFSMVFLADVPAGVRLPILGVSIACAGVGAAFVVIYLWEQDRTRPRLQ
jgi:hypothetical protein